MLGPSIRANLPFLRRQAESLQTDRCVITRPGVGDGTFDPQEGVSTPPPPTTVYSGPCRLRPPDLAQAIANAGEHDFTVQQYVMFIPASSPQVRVDDTVRITASADAPDLVDRVFTVGAAAAGSQQTARRFVVQEVTS